MENIPALPQPPFDYGYAVAILAGLGTVLLAGLVYVARSYIAYRNKQDDKRDEQWRIAEATRVEARQRLESNFERRFDKMESDTEEFFRTLAAENADLKERIHELDKHIHGLKPPKEGGR